MNEINKRIVKQARFLLQGLIISIALNIGLILALFVLFIKEAPSLFESKPADLKEQVASVADIRGHADVVKLFETLSFEQLLSKLDSKILIEDGFTERDLALGCLVSFYHFNLEKALAKMPLEQRNFAILNQDQTKHNEVLLFPGLTDEEFKTIAYFAKTEVWPLTSQGLFLRIKQSGPEIPQSLTDCFFLTPEFGSAEALLSHSNAEKDRMFILSILTEGDWKMLEEFTIKQKTINDLSAAHQQRFLLDYIGRGSKKAAEYMLQVHGAFAVKKLDDAHVIAILSLLDQKTPRSEAFAKALLVSPRSEAVWKLAASKLYQFANEPMIEPYDHMKVLARFIPVDVIQKKTQAAKEVIHQSPLQNKPAKAITTPFKKKAEEKKKITHTIQSGESLSTIAKKYKITVKELKAANNLQSDVIVAGKTLVIP